jgi:hypothetical protein
LDARTYLQKFYNIIVHFPEPGHHRHERIVPKYIAYLAKEMSLSADDLEILENAAEARDLSLRTIERIVTNISLARQFTPENYLWLRPIISGLCIMKVTDPSLFRRARYGTLDIDEVRRALGIANWPNYDPSHNEWMMNWWIFCLAADESNFSNIDWKGFDQSLVRYGIRSRKDIVRLMAGHIDGFQLPSLVPTPCPFSASPISSRIAGSSMVAGMVQGS